jgi:membrane-associated phospholipid phosphatase
VEARDNRHSRRRLILLAVLVAAFTAEAVALPDAGGMGLDHVVANALQAHATQSGEIVFTWISWLGDTALAGLLVAAVALLTWKRRYSAAVTVVVAGVGAPLIDVLLKRIFQRGRPDFALELIAGVTWSFPSGHAMSSLVGFGVIAYFRQERELDTMKRVLIVLTAALVIAAIGFSRLYLGVHYLSDVLGGFLAGAIWLLACIEAYYYSARLKRR